MSARCGPRNALARRGRARGVGRPPRLELWLALLGSGLVSLLTACVPWTDIGIGGVGDGRVDASGGSEAIGAEIARVLPGVVVRVALRQDGLARALDVSLTPGRAAEPGESPDPGARIQPDSGPSSLEGRPLDVASLAAALAAIARTVPADAVSVRLSVRDAAHRVIPIAAELRELGFAESSIESNGTLWVTDVAGLRSRFEGSERAPPSLDE